MLLLARGRNPNAKAASSMTHSFLSVIATTIAICASAPLLQAQGVALRVTLGGRADSVFASAVASAQARGYRVTALDSARHSATVLSRDSVSLRITVVPRGDSSLVTMAAAPTLDDTRAFQALFLLGAAIRQNVVSATPVGPLPQRRP
ncbi:MAG TPA: hypothetical protein VNL98_06845 [Gemmatimonadales bacterium]|nr:hypothetical protein [Gemmatimonadales bacterium]